MGDYKFGGVVLGTVVKNYDEKKQGFVQVNICTRDYEENKMVWETLMDVIRYAEPENVQRLGIIVMGGNIVSNELLENERYRVGQKEVKPGLYVNTYSSTDTKYEQIKKINRSLDLGLIVEKVML